MAKWFMVNADGLVVSILGRASVAEAEAQLKPGCRLEPFDPAVDPRRARLTGEGWVTPPPADPAYDVMRRTGYDVGAQVGALMKIVEALLADPVLAARIPPAARAEFDALVARNAALKAAHPKP